MRTGDGPNKSPGDGGKHRKFDPRTTNPNVHSLLPDSKAKVEMKGSRAKYGNIDSFYGRDSKLFWQFGEGYISIKRLYLNVYFLINPDFGRKPVMRSEHDKIFKNTCPECAAVAYCCGAITPCVIAALLGRFLPRLGPLAFASGPFFCPAMGSKRRQLIHHAQEKFRALKEAREDAYSAAAWNGPRLSSGIAASASASTMKSSATLRNCGPRSRRRSSM